MEDSTTRATAQGIDPAEVCSLPPEGLAERIAWIRAEILPDAVSKQRLPDGLSIELRDRQGLAERIDLLVDLESACCPDLVIRRHASDVAGQVRLEIRGVDPDAPIFADVAAGNRASSGRRLFEAAFAGVSMSLAVCCVLPIAAAATLGAATAAPLASLDQPAPIGLGAVLAGGATWWWRRRR